MPVKPDNVSCLCPGEPGPRGRRVGAKPRRGPREWARAARSDDRSFPRFFSETAHTLPAKLAPRLAGEDGGECLPPP
jgi:hypothetical protein